MNHKWYSPEDSAAQYGVPLIIDLKIIPHKKRITTHLLRKLHINLSHGLCTPVSMHRWELRQEPFLWAWRQQSGSLGPEAHWRCRRSWLCQRWWSLSWASHAEAVCPSPRALHSPALHTQPLSPLMSSTKKKASFFFIIMEHVEVYNTNVVKFCSLDHLKHNSKWQHFSSSIIKVIWTKNSEYDNMSD